MAFTQVIKFNVKPDFVEKFKHALSISVKGTIEEEGNLAIRIYQDSKNLSVFFAYERWINKEAMAIHQRQPYIKTLIELAASALATPPNVYDLEDTSPAPIEPLEADLNDPKFDIFFIFKIKPGSRDKLLAQFKHHISNTRTEPGCLLFDLYTVKDDEETLVVYEHWRKESDVWDIHFKQPYAMETGKLMEEYVVGDMQKYMNFVTKIA